MVPWPQCRRAMYRPCGAVRPLCKVLSRCWRTHASAAPYRASGVRQIVQDGAIGPAVARAQAEQGFQAALHGLQRFDALAKRLLVLLGDALDAGAAALSVVPQADQLGDVNQAETHVAGAADEAQGVHVGQAVLAVIALGAVYRTEHAE